MKNELHKEHFDSAGVYIGPPTWEGDMDLHNYMRDGSKVKHLEKLRVVKGTLTLPEDLDPWDLIPNVVRVEGDLGLDLAGVSFSKLPNLEQVDHIIDMESVDVDILENLRQTKGPIFIGRSAVPYLPKLEDKSTSIGCESRKDALGDYRKSPSYSYCDDYSFGAEWSDDELVPYNFFLNTVRKTPVDMLVPLRLEKPYLAHIIDAKLKSNFEDLHE